MTERHILPYPGKIYRYFLEKVLMRLFIRPDVAVSTAFLGASPSSREELAASAMSLVMSAGSPSPEKTLASYCQGLVLRGKSDRGVLEWDPLPERAIITPETVHIPERVNTFLREPTTEVNWNLDFEAVLRECSRNHSIWINAPLMEIYRRLFAMGAAASIEAYRGEELVGGICGIRVGHTFSVGGMFQREERVGIETSGTLMNELVEGDLGMVDCGPLTSQFALFGAEVVSREVFIEKVVQGLIKS